MPENGSREAYELAAEIMDVDLSEYSLYLNADKTSYEYRDPDETLSADKSSSEPSPAPKEQPKPHRKKRGAKGQER
jgi:hypothetical protein